ncbi:hypothetical protein HMPREF1248_0586 [Coriobacteriaceae bacterium BV3Ac1]|nr:hypothetical protein HMPREF1248_0586 [Coriobacteriaceae bacterium BV3Ac1]
MRTHLFNNANNLDDAAIEFRQTVIICPERDTTSSTGTIIEYRFYIT